MERLHNRSFTITCQSIAETRNRSFSRSVASWRKPEPFLYRPVPFRYRSFHPLIKNRPMLHHTNVFLNYKLLTVALPASTIIVGYSVFWGQCTRYTKWLITYDQWLIRASPDNYQVVLTHDQDLFAAKKVAKKGYLKFQKCLKVEKFSKKVPNRSFLPSEKLFIT